MKQPAVKKHSSPIRQLKEDGGMIVQNSHYTPDEITATLVARSRAQGLSVEQCAKILGISAATVKKYYEDEFEEGTASLIQKMTQTMATIALDPGHKQAVSAGKFMLARLAPDIFAERSVVQYLDRNGRATDPNQATVLDPYQMTDDQRDALRNALASVLKDAVDEAAEHKMQREAIEVEAIEYSGDDTDYEEVDDGRGDD